MTVSTIALTLGVSLPYASDIRAGQKRPHPTLDEPCAARGPVERMKTAILQIKLYQEKLMKIRVWPKSLGRKCCFGVVSSLYLELA